LSIFFFPFFYEKVDGNDEDADDLEDGVKEEKEEGTEEEE